MNAKPDRRNQPAPAARPINVWTPDAEVQVGYMRLRVVKRIPTPGDGKPDQWLLTSLNGDRDYRFAPYSGLRLVADRRPAKVAKPRLAVVPKTTPKPQAAAPRAAKTQPALAQLDRPLSGSELARLDRVEETLARVAALLERTVRG